MGEGEVRKSGSDKYESEKCESGSVRSAEAIKFQMAKIK